MWLLSGLSSALIPCNIVVKFKSEKKLSQKSDLNPGRERLKTSTLPLGHVGFSKCTCKMHSQSGLPAAGRLSTMFSICPLNTLEAGFTDYSEVCKL